MSSRKDRLMSAAVRAAKQAKQWAIAATREADQLLKAAKKRAETIERKRQLKKRLQQTARVMKSAGKAAVVAGVAAGIAAAVLLALLVGYLCVRHTEIYFAMLTLACGMMVFSLVWNAREITGGDDGLIGIMRAPVSLFGGIRMPIGKDEQFYFFVLFFFALSVWAVHRIRQSPFGLALAGIRENARRSEFAGVPVRRYRLAVFVLSGAFAGLAGSLEALLESNARPFMAHWTHSAEPVLVSLLGGLSSLAGPLVGSAIYIAMREIIQRFTENWMLGFGIVLLVIIMGFRGGVTGTLSALFRKAAAPGEG